MINDSVPVNYLPVHEFHIGENASAHIGQLPNFRAMAFHVIGKSPMTIARSDAFDMGPYVLGRLVGDAALKLMRPWPAPGAASLCAGPGQGLIADIADLLLPLSPSAAAVRGAYYYRIGEILDIALCQPGRLPEIVDNIDSLTNARLTQRARAILTTGDDPGAGDLWRSVVACTTEGRS